MNGPGTNDDLADVRRLLAECGIEESPELLSTLLRLREIGRGTPPDPSPELAEQFGAQVLPLNPRPPRRRGFLLSAALIGAMAAGTSGVAASNPALSVVSERQDDEEAAEGPGGDPDAAGGEDTGQVRDSSRPDALDDPGEDKSGTEPDYSAGGIPPEADVPDTREPAAPETAGAPAAEAADPEVAAAPAAPEEEPQEPRPADPAPAQTVSPVPAAARADAAPGSLPAADPLPAHEPVPAADPGPDHEPAPAAEPGPAAGAPEPVPAAEEGMGIPAPWDFDHAPFRGRGAPGEDWNRSGGGSQPRSGFGHGPGNVPAWPGRLPAPSYAGR